MDFFDSQGQKISRTALTESIDGAVRLRDQHSTYPSVSLSPAKLATILREADQGHVLRQCELFEEMEEKDPALGSKLMVRRAAVQALELEVAPASPRDEDKKIALALRENLEDMDLAGPFLRLLDAIGKGFATVEINWQLSEGMAWVDSFNWIPQKRWTFAQPSTEWATVSPTLPRLLTDAKPVYGEEVTAFKVVFHRSLARSGFSQRAGLLRGLAYFYLFKNYAIKDWVVFLEKYGQPLRIGKFSPNASEEDIRVLREAVQCLGTDSGVIISDQTALDIIEAKDEKFRGSLYEALATYIDHIYTIGILGQSATTEDTTGSEKPQLKVCRDILRADARALAVTLRRQVARPWVGFNFGWDKRVPLLRFPHAEVKDLAALAKTHKTLVELGVPIPLSYVQKVYGLPAPSSESLMHVKAAVEDGKLVVDLPKRAVLRRQRKAQIS